jgi:ubiquinone/menaquinone biosynthesis C-methylase UbiE
VSSYIGRHGEFYDLFYREKPYEQEAAFVHQCLQREASAPPKCLLELACGTGTHAIYFAKMGYHITATDYSPDMLDCARRKATEEQVSLSIDFRQQDMRWLPTPEQPYDAVVCLFDSIGYVQTDDALNKVFHGIHRNLRDGGLFVFEFWHALAMLKGHDPVRVRRFAVAGGTILRISETTLLRDQSLARVTYNIYDLRDNGSYDHLTESQTNRYFTVPQMQIWAIGRGFQPLAYYSGFNEVTTITDDTWHVVAVWRKRVTS